MVKKGALITGITGQDGYYLSELLLEKDYRIWGIIQRPKPCFLSSKIVLLEKDITINSMIKEIFEIIFDDDSNIEILEIYNLGAVSNLKDSFDYPLVTININGVNITRFLEEIRISPYKNKIRFCQASSTEMFGIEGKIHTEKDPFYPNSPYGASKLYAHNMIKIYREKYNIFACSSITSNHESPKRGENFISKKITTGISKIKKGEINHLLVGNLEAKRDWSHARDIVYAMWLMLQSETPDDFILSSNETHSVREFIELAFSLIGIKIKWKGYGLNEIGYFEDREYIKISSEYYRPSAEPILGDSTSIRTKLNWQPKYSFYQLVEEMVSADC